MMLRSTFGLLLNELKVRWMYSQNLDQQKTPKDIFFNNLKTHSKTHSKDVYLYEKDI